MIRLLIEKDIPIVLSFIHDTFRQDPHYDKHQQDVLTSYATPLSMMNAMNYYYAVVFETEDEHVVGVGAVDKNLVVYLFVNPHFQGMGIGAKLLRHIEEYTMSHYNFGGKAKMMYVFSSELAFPFYSKYGYVELKRIDHLAGGVTIVRIHMRKLLSDN